MNRTLQALLEKIRKNSQGFTMIELLVVIAVIGILAVAVLSALNPIEQINKGRDTRVRSDAGEVLSASERYFSIHEVYPWNETRTGTDTNPATPYTAASTDYSQSFTWIGPTAAAGTGNWIYQLSTTQEVKPAFAARVLSDKKLVVLRATGENESTYVCFAPSSYAFRFDAAKNCNTTTTPAGTQVATINSFTVCGSTTGAVYGTTAGPATPNYICLP